MSPGVRSRCPWLLSSAGGIWGWRACWRPLHQGWEEPGPSGANRAVRAAELQDTAGGLAGPQRAGVSEVGGGGPAGSASAPQRLGCSRQRPMYSSSQKKTVAQPEGPAAPSGDSGRGQALQRPLELVPRQVLPDGGLGAGRILQFSPDHLRAETRCESTTASSPAGLHTHVSSLLSPESGQRGH